MVVCVAGWVGRGDGAVQVEWRRGAAPVLSDEAEGRQERRRWRAPPARKEKQMKVGPYIRDIWFVILLSFSFPSIIYFICFGPMQQQILISYYSLHLLEM